MDNKIRCIVCEDQIAKMKCLMCSSKSYYCDICFAFIHRSGAKKDHTPEALIPQEINTLTESTVDVPTKDFSCENSNVGYCLIHKEETNKYYCQECHSFKCQKCLSGDKNCQHQLQIVHNDKMSSIQNEIKISKDNSEFDVSKIKDQLDKLTNMQKQCNMIIEGFTEQLKMFKTYVVKFFDHIHKLIEENKILIIQIIDNNDEPNIQFLKQLSTQIEKEKKELSNKIVGMDKKNKIASKGTNFSMDPNALQNDQSFDKIIMGFEKKKIGRAHV